jgi:hypothetical protein
MSTIALALDSVGLVARVRHMNRAKTFSIREGEGAVVGTIAYGETKTVDQFAYAATR